MKSVLMTGAAGFIGHAISMRLLERGDAVLGVDNLNHSYDIHLKQARLERLTRMPRFQFSQVDISDRQKVPALFKSFRPEITVNLAAQGGVRRSAVDPNLFLDSNLQGFLNILEGSRGAEVKHFVYASSGAVYGANRKLPFSTSDPVDHPLSLYAATKRANELIAHSYSHLYRIPTTGLRLFTVYGPWGRPDMAVFQFTRAIFDEMPIDLFNDGKHRRDFIYIDDIVEGFIRAIDRPATPDMAWDSKVPAADSSDAPYRIYNLGNNAPVWLEEVIRCLEAAIGKKATVRLAAGQAGDVLESHADMSCFQNVFGFSPRTSIQQGLSQFVSWYRDYFKR